MANDPGPEVILNQSQNKILSILKNFFTQRKALLLILLAISPILLVLTVFLLKSFLNISSSRTNKIVLSIDDKKITNEEYQKVISYLQTSFKDKQHSMTRANEIFITNELLKKGLSKQGYNFSQGDFKEYLKRTGQDTPTTLGLHLELENDHLKQILIERYLSWYSGEYIFVRFDNPQLTLTLEEKKARAKKKIDEIQDKWKSGKTFRNLIAEYNMDREIKILNNEQSFANTFDKLLLDNPLVKAPEILDIIPKLKSGEISEVIIISDPNRLGETKPIPFAYALVKLTQSQQGVASSFEEFINQIKAYSTVKVFVK